MQIKTYAPWPVALLLGSLFSQASLAVELKTEQDKLSYAYGQNIGKSLKRQGAEINPDIFVQAIHDAIAGKSEMDDKAMAEAIFAFQKNQMAKRQAEQAAESKENADKGTAFLADNAKKEGVITLSSGLQYKVIKAGTGKTPSADDTVETHYSGRLLDGTEFDSSYKRGKPATFPVKGVIKGWTEALQLMQEGAKWQLFIPADLAYGERGSPPRIGANATLIFDIELLSIKAK
jgi:FKBP-type peptidyl-prolyl cis-trans isomerase FklB